MEGVTDMAKAEVLDLALPDQLFHRSSNVFDGHIWIDAVLIKRYPAVRATGDVS
jgi:hypothetical protein